jgi:putative DNA primase/helicase
VSQEKGFMTIGPKRSGKDTMRNVLQALLPSGAVAGPTLDSLVTNFGLSSLINKTLAIVGDMRIGKKTDKELLAENVLKLTGRGWFTIDRKNKSHWDGFLPCKLWLISNDRPAFTDTSGALASRFIIFRTRNSFFGFENPNLFRDKLKPELGGILLWALEGLRRVRARGKLSEPQSSIEERDALAREGSPVMAFVAERLTLDANATLDKDELRAAYNSWAEANGFYLKTKDRLMRDLVSATGGKVHAAKVWQGKGDDARQVPVAKGASLIATQHTGGDDGLPF